MFTVPVVVGLGGGAAVVPREAPCLVTCCDGGFGDAASDDLAAACGVRQSGFSKRAGFPAGRARLPWAPQGTGASVEWPGGRPVPQHGCTRG